MKAACEQERLARQAQANYWPICNKVTVRQRVEEELRESEKQTIFGSCASGVFVVVPMALLR